MDIEFMEYWVNMKGKVVSGMAGRNVTKAKQILMINKVFVDIVTGNGYRLAMKWQRGCSMREHHNPAIKINYQATSIFVAW